MYRDQVIKQIRANRSRLNELDVKSLALFGSVARGDDRPDSDVDVLVEFQGTVTWKKYIFLKRLLEDLLGRSVDVSTRDVVDSFAWSIISKDLIDVE